MFSGQLGLIAAHILGASLGVVLVAGCGSGGEPGTAVPPPAATISVPAPDTGAPAPGGSRAPGATSPRNEARPDPGVVDLRPVRWNRVEPAADGRSLTVHFKLGKPPCSMLGRVDTDEAVDAVTVTLMVGRLPHADCSGPQPLIASPRTVTVQLDSPLDGRPVRDGAA